MRIALLIVGEASKRSNRAAGVLGGTRRGRCVIIVYNFADCVWDGWTGGAIKGVPRPSDSCTFRVQAA